MPAKYSQDHVALYAVRWTDMHGRVYAEQPDQLRGVEQTSPYYRSRDDHRTRLGFRP